MLESFKGSLLDVRPARGDLSEDPLLWFGERSYVF